jgi:hypothetical protein
MRKETNMNKRKIVEEFYRNHPDAGDYSDVWFDKWNHILDIVRDWDDDCIEADYDCICDWVDGEKHLKKWVERDKKGDRNGQS